MNKESVEPNDDAEFDPEELEEASEERITPGKAPEVDSKTENLTKWDEPASNPSGVVPKVPLEDEAPVAEELVEGGMDEADRELRIAAADPDFEP